MINFPSRKLYTNDKLDSIRCSIYFTFGLKLSILSVKLRTKKSEIYSIDHSNSSVPNGVKKQPELADSGHIRSKLKT